jgi:GntR family transcriptional repressor for pyruvate dehydrogenase complex
MTVGNIRNRDKLHLSVASAFEAQILSGERAIGEHLPSEGEIARDFRVSTRSVREAMQILEIKGLVRRRHGGRTSVVRADVGEFMGTLAVTVRQLLSSDPDYLLQLMVARRMIETEVLGILTAREKPVNEEITTALDGMRHARDTGDFTAFTIQDAAFHLALVHSAAYAEHEEIYTMIRNRDETGAKALLRAQIDNSAAYLRITIDNANRKEENYA